MAAFFSLERIAAGWRFYVLWVIMTALGWGAGVALELLLFSNINLIIAVPLAGVMQGWVVGRHEPIWILYSTGTALAWLIGVVIADQLLITTELPQLLHLILVSLFAGTVAGVPQWLVLNSEIKAVGWWWIVVSALGKASLIPGVITGAVLMRYVESYEAYVPKSKTGKTNSEDSE